MSHMCAICSKGSAPFGLFDPLDPIGQRRHTWFCSNAHQRLWLRLIKLEEDILVTLNALECKAIEQALPSVGHHVATSQIGDRSINQLTKEEVLGLIANCVKSYQTKLYDLTEEDGPPLPA